MRDAFLNLRELLLGLPRKSSQPKLGLRTAQRRWGGNAARLTFMGRRDWPPVERLDADDVLEPASSVMLEVLEKTVWSESVAGDRRCCRCAVGGLCMTA